jgi:hypothetical protein
MDNRDSGIKLWTESHPDIVNCIVAGNGGAGIEMWAEQSEQTILFNYAEVTNCTIVGNARHGIYGGLPAVTNSIVQQNGVDGSLAQIEAHSAIASYCNISGAFPGEGNMDHDPGFMVPGYWSDPNDPNAFWVHGDYHLDWDSFCINAGDPDFVAAPDQYDMDGEPRVIDERVDIGADEVSVGLMQDEAGDTRDLAMLVQFR